MGPLPFDSEPTRDVDAPSAPKSPAPRPRSDPPAADSTPVPDVEPDAQSVAQRAEDEESEGVEKSAGETESAEDARQQLRSQTCGNCGAQREGPYCHVCGQRYRNGPLTFKDLWHQVVFVFFDLERGFLYTVRKMTTSPDQVARRYLDGEHRRFLSPVAYYLIMLTVLTIGYSLVQDAWIRQMGESMAMFTSSTGEDLQAAYKAFGVENREGYLRAMFDLFVSYSQYLGVVSVVSIAVGVRLLIKQRTLAEWLAVSLYVWGQISLYTCLVQFVTVHLSPLWTSVSGAAVQAVLVAWTFSIFGESRWKSAALALLGMYGSIIVLSLAFGLIILLVSTVASWFGVDVSQFLFGF
jgi:hypothetical protein